jgi:hypothetical protein
MLQVGWSIAKGAASKVAEESQPEAHSAAFQLRPSDPRLEE